MLNTDFTKGRTILNQPNSRQALWNNNHVFIFYETTWVTKWTLVESIKTNLSL